MPIIGFFVAVFALTFLAFKMRGQKTADCIHKGLVAGILASVVAFAAVTAFSYV
jgi:hypothetical protein